MKKGFTLLELLVVVAIMGLLGTAATNAYTSLVRGMNERSAIASASGILRAASERAQIDRVPTAVFCYNKLIKAPTATENGVVAGMMTAIRRSGRVTYVSGNSIYDEFADLDHTYEVAESDGELAHGGGWRLFYFGGNNMSRMEYSIVSDRVMIDEPTVALFTGNGNTIQTNLFTSAYYDTGKSAYPHTWKTGEAYGFEFNELQLPDGMIFGGNVPTEANSVELVKTIVFDPENPNVEEIEINSTKPDASGLPQKFKKVGQASSDSDKAI